MIVMCLLAVSSRCGDSDVYLLGLAGVVIVMCLLAGSSRCDDSDVSTCWI